MGEKRTGGHTLQEQIQKTRRERSKMTFIQNYAFDYIYQLSTQNINYSDMYHVFKVFKITTLYATWCHSKPLIPKQLHDQRQSPPFKLWTATWAVIGMYKLASDLFLGSEFMKLSILTTQPIYFLCVSSGEFRFRSLEIIKGLSLSIVSLTTNVSYSNLCLRLRCWMKLPLCCCGFPQGMEAQMGHTW